MGPTPPHSTAGPPQTERPGFDEASDLRDLFHRLNNELGIILSHAELLAAKSADQATRSRAAQVVTSALDAMNTARNIRIKTVGTPDGTLR